MPFSKFCTAAGRVVRVKLILIMTWCRLVKHGSTVGQHPVARILEFVMHIDAQFGRELRTQDRQFAWSILVDKPQFQTRETTFSLVQACDLLAGTEAVRAKFKLPRLDPAWDWFCAFIPYPPPSSSTPFSTISTFSSPPSAKRSAPNPSPPPSNLAPAWKQHDRDQNRTCTAKSNAGNDILRPVCTRNAMFRV